MNVDQEMKIEIIWTFQHVVTVRPFTLECIENINGVLSLR